MRYDEIGLLNVIQKYFIPRIISFGQTLMENFLPYLTQFQQSETHLPIVHSTLVGAKHVCLSIPCVISMGQAQEDEDKLNTLDLVH